MSVRPFLPITVSLLVHSCLVGLIMLFSSDVTQSSEKVYQVTLAEFAMPAAAAAPSLPAEAEQPAPPEPAPPPEPQNPEPVVEKTEPKQLPEEPPKPKEKTISTKKSAEKPKLKPKKEEKLPPRTPVQAAVTGNAAPRGGPTLTIGGTAAYDVDAVDQRPSISRRVMPDYPQKARRMNVEGRVDVRILVDSSGQAKQCNIHRANPTGYFEDAALSAARKTRFIPGKVKGQPVNTVVIVPFVFALR